MDAQQILFVEDDVIISCSTCDFLRDRGIRVLEACCATAAKDVLAHLPYLSGLVTDIDLGAGENGFDVARRMRLDYPGLPVVFVSGAGSSRHSIEGVEDSIFIHKPYHPRQIVDALAKLAPYEVVA